MSLATPCSSTSPSECHYVSPPNPLCGGCQDELSTQRETAAMLRSTSDGEMDAVEEAVKWKMEAQVMGWDGMG